MDCGPTCLRMVAKYYGRSVSREYLRSNSLYSRIGTSLLGLADAAESLGFNPVGAKLTFEQLINEAPLPAILHWDQYHFVILTPDSNINNLIIADPAKGLLKYTQGEFLQHWATKVGDQKDSGTVLLLEPGPMFEQVDLSSSVEEPSKLINKHYLFNYIRRNKVYFTQLLLGSLVGSILQLILPYLTQSIVDKGIDNRDINFVTIILLAQLMLLFSQTAIEFIRSRILLHISTKISLSLISEFWNKLLKLPMHFFDSKHPGDILQRITDHERIENFLTDAILNTLFSLSTIVVFSIVLLLYNKTIFFIFLIGSFIYLVWIRLFLHARRKLDYQRFSLASREKDSSMQLVYGMQEIKLNNAENTHRWAWESLQAGLFKLNFRSLALVQFQQVGAFFINQGKNLLITFIVARLVIGGSLSLGMMLAIQYIIGQLNSPIDQLINFTQRAQDAKISLERINDIHGLSDEEPLGHNLIHHIPEEGDIHLQNVSFTYPGNDEPVLKNINLRIAMNKTTAIVGMSGSGKTTLLKLLLKFYHSYDGNIHVGNSNFKIISPKFWRSISGAVMQDSFIFNSSIRNNIAVTNDKVNEYKLLESCRMANILPYIESMPLGFNTKLGSTGIGISGGQKQRIAIARAIYKNPKFVFFDEATNSLDANNENLILNNLNSFFNGRTVIIVAHRLSTVRNADNIVVLDKGKIVEEGNHEKLVALKGYYFELVRNQLELGS